jgi:hypothetical protein
LLTRSQIRNYAKSYESHQQSTTFVEIAPREDPSKKRKSTQLVQTTSKRPRTDTIESVWGYSGPFMYNPTEFTQWIANRSDESLRGEFQSDESDEGVS